MARGRMQFKNDQSKPLARRGPGASTTVRRKSTDPLSDEWDEFVIRFDREKGRFDISTEKIDLAAGIIEIKRNAKSAG